MRKRINNDFDALVEVLHEGVKIDLSLYEITSVRMVSNQAYKVTDYEVRNGSLFLHVTPLIVPKPGKYKIVVTYRMADPTLADGFWNFEFDKYLVTIVGSSEEEDAGEVVITADAVIGMQGKSAYQVWLDAGNIGTVEDYLADIKGDPLTYDDLTPEQKAELQQPATDAIASIQEVELAVETAEGLRQQAEIDRQTNTSTAISNANNAAILANEKAGLANDAALLANEKAGLAATATTQANEARDGANMAAQTATNLVNSYAADLAKKANHGYASNPKTLKQIDDSLVQLAGDVTEIFKNNSDVRDYSHRFTLVGRYINYLTGGESGSSIFKASDGYIDITSEDVLLINYEQPRDAHTRNCVAFYDESKAFIVGRTAVEINSNIFQLDNLRVIYPPSNATQFRASMLDATMPKCYVLNKRSLLFYLLEHYSKISDNSDVYYSINDSQVLHSGIFSASPIHHRTDYRDIDSSKYILLKGDYRNAGFCMYDENKIAINDNTIINIGDLNIIDVPASAKYYIHSKLITNGDNAIIVDKTTSPGYLILELIERIRSGKKIIFGYGAPYKNYLTWRSLGGNITKDGVFLAFGQAFEATEAADGYKSDIVIMRSIDTGETWEHAFTIANNGVVSNSRIANLTSVVDNVTGTIFVIASSIDQVDNWTKQGVTPDNYLYDTFIISSTDDGVTWSGRTSIKSLIDAKFPDLSGTYSTSVVHSCGGCGQGWQMTNGTLVMPIQIIFNQYGGTAHPNPIESALLTSTDGGVTWVVSNTTGQYTSECSGFEIETGKILLNCRSYGSDNLRWQFETSDLGQTWQLHTGNKKLNSPGDCFGSIAKLTMARQDFYFFTNPDTNYRDAQDSGRRFHTLKISDDAINWERVLCYEDRLTMGMNHIIAKGDELILFYENINKGVNFLNLSREKGGFRMKLR